MTYRQHSPYRRVICRGLLYETGRLFSGPDSALASHLRGTRTGTALRGTLLSRLPPPPHRIMSKKSSTSTSSAFASAR